MARSPFLFSTHDLPRRAGEMREYQLSITAHGGLESGALSVPKDEPIDIDLRIQSVSEGVLATAHVETFAVGECGRCLDRLEFDISEDFSELYEYEKDSRGKKAKNSEDEEDLDVLHMIGEEIDLDGPVRDSIFLNLPLNPLCKADCQGLCPECGEKLESLPKDHAHEKLDARWAALGDLKERLGDENTRDK